MRFAAELKKKGREKLKRGEGGLVLQALVVLGWALLWTQFLRIDNKTARASILE